MPSRRVVRYVAATDGQRLAPRRQCDPPRDGPKTVCEQVPGRYRHTAVTSIPSPRTSGRPAVAGGGRPSVGRGRTDGRIESPNRPIDRDRVAETGVRVRSCGASPFAESEHRDRSGRNRPPWDRPGRRPRQGQSVHLGGRQGTSGHVTSQAADRPIRARRRPHRRATGPRRTGPAAARASRGGWPCPSRRRGSRTPGRVASRCRRGRR